MISQYLLDPDIDLTSEETQWRDVELWYRQVCFDEFQFADRLRFFAVKWLLDDQSYPRWDWRIPDRGWRWHWFSKSLTKQHAEVFPDEFVAKHLPLGGPYRSGHKTFGESVLWFTSLWPRFYVEVVLPTQIDEPANAEEFWENLNLCFPGEDWRKKFCPIYFDEDYYVVQWFDVRGDVLQRMDELRDKFDRDPHYCWNWGNAAIRAMKAWRGEAK